MPQSRLLVVEDDPGVRTTIVTCLELEGYAVDAAVHGELGAAETP